MTGLLRRDATIVIFWLTPAVAVSLPAIAAAIAVAMRPRRGHAELPARYRRSGDALA